MQLEIAEGVALDTASNIERIVSSFNADMDRLNTILTSKINEGIQTQWADEVKSNWQTYYTSDIETIKEEMLNSATNLKKAVDAWVAYNKGK